MSWIDFPENKPNTSGTFIVSINTITAKGKDYTFRYLAYYDLDQNKWFKYDSFAIGNEILEEIKDRINGWTETPPVYLRG